MNEKQDLINGILDKIVLLLHLDGNVVFTAGMQFKAIN